MESRMKRIGQYLAIGLLIASIVSSNAMALDAVPESGAAEPIEEVLPTPPAEDEKEKIEVPAVREVAEGTLVDEEVVIEPTNIPAEVSPPLAQTDTSTKEDDAPAQSESGGLPLTPPISLERDDIFNKDDTIAVNGFVLVDRQVQAVELVGRKDNALLADYELRIIRAVVGGNEEREVACYIQPDGYVLDKQRLTMTQKGVEIRLDGKTKDGLYGTSMLDCDTSGTALRIELYKTGQASPTELINLEKAPYLTVNGTWKRKSTNSKEFEKTSGNLGYSEPYFPPESAPLTVTEVYVTPFACPPVDSSALCRRYVKVRNDSTGLLDLSHYRLRGGLITSKSTSTNTTILTGLIESGETRLITGDTVYLGAKEGTVWFEDARGLKTYQSESAVSPYSSADTVGHRGLSWAYDSSDDTWKWSVPSPETSDNVIRLPEERAEVTNLLSTLVPCRANQYRSAETNRCRTKQGAIVLVPCKNGQYRSEETNRCRSIALAGGTLKPCRDNQYRSETTNRCRNIALASRQLVPCKDNQYRSEETNRCRAVQQVAIPTAAFAVEPVADTATAFAGWWALGGVGLLAAGYGAWEWRDELRRGVRRMAGMFHKGN